MPDDFALLESIFVEAVAKADVAARTAYLDEVCASDPSLRNRVEALLMAHEAADDLLKLPNAIANYDTVDYISEGPGTTIGHYKLLEQIGEGGFGVVFMAEQEQAVRRKVAIKIIKRGMDTRQVVARFEAERQALAMMDHPSIAKVFDAGTTETGRPYFVMELIRGIPITDYCDNQAVTIPRRLELFMQICQAVQHAHQKGIIHRDLKPSNVLVTLHNVQALPKIIDFGVAKAIEGKLTERTLFTGFHQLIGTPVYMSPEQAQLSGIDVDTRSDIYSLGVLLYELLTGSTPFDSKQLLDAPFDEMRRIVREVDPPTPSRRLSTLDADSQNNVAAARNSDPKRLRRLLGGDLDWIVMKCLEKDRTRRYATAIAVAEDVQRFLASQPVEARRPTRWYRLTKLLHRNRVGVLAGLAVTLALVIGLTLASLEYFEAGRQTEIGRTEATKASVAQRNAEAALQRAEHNELLQRRQSYAAKMNLAQQALAGGDFARVLDLLESTRPHADELDLRGFEWYYLWRQIHPGVRESLFYEGGGEYWGLAISPDGKTIAISAGSTDKERTVRLWDTDSGKLKLVLPSFGNGASLLTFSSDGSKLAGGSWDGTICLWNLTPASELPPISAKFGSMVRSLQFSHNGQHLAAGFGDGSVQIIDATLLRLVERLKPHSGPALNVFYSPDGKNIYSAAAWGTEGTVTRVHDLTSNPRESRELKGLRATDISPDGRFLACGWQNDIVVWDLATAKETCKFKPHAGTIEDVKFTPDGEYLVSAAREERTAIVWSIATQKSTMRIPHSAPMSALAMARNDKRVCASLSVDGTTEVWDYHPRADASAVRLDHPIDSMLMMPDGRSILLGGDFRAKSLDVDSGRVGELVPPATHVFSLSADGRLLGSIEQLEPNLRGVKIWEMDTGLPKFVVPTPNLVAEHWRNKARVSPDGTRLAACCANDGPVLIWELASVPSNVAEQSRDRSAPPQLAMFSSCSHIEFSPNSQWLAVSRKFGNVSLYDFKTKQTVHVPLPTSSWANRVAYSPSARFLASGNDAGVVSVFDVEIGDIIASLAGHEAGITALAFFPDERTLAVGTYNTIRLWDVPSHQERIAFKLTANDSADQFEFVDQLAVTPDGRTLISHQADGTVRIWKGAKADIQVRIHAEGTKNNAVGDPQFYARRAIARIGLGHWEAAISDFGEAERLGLEWNAGLFLSAFSTVSANMEPTGQFEIPAAKQVFEYLVSIADRCEDANCLNAAAWGLVRNAGTDRRKAALAVKFAAIAAERSPHNGSIENTLGVAYYRLGDWHRAIESLHKSLELRKGGSAVDWFFLAMAHWKLGHVDEARKWYRDSIDWMQKHEVDDDEVLRFGREAAELIEPQQSSTQP